MKTTLTAALVVALACATLSGCIGISGGMETKHQLPTKGRELIDLKEALDRNAISQPEYDRMKADIEAGRNRGCKHHK